MLIPVVSQGHMRVPPSALPPRARIPFHIIGLCQRRAGPCALDESGQSACCRRDEPSRQCHRSPRAIDDTPPPSRNSLTIRLHLPNARSMRPSPAFCWHRLSMFAPNSARPNGVTKPVAAGSVFAVHPKIVAFRCRNAPGLPCGPPQIESRSRPEVIQCRFRVNEPRTAAASPSRRIIHKTQPCMARSSRTRCAPTVNLRPIRPGNRAAARLMWRRQRCRLSPPSPSAIIQRAGSRVTLAPVMSLTSSSPIVRPPPRSGLNLHTALSRTIDSARVRTSERGAMLPGSASALWKAGSCTVLREGHATERTT